VNSVTLRTYAGRARETETRGKERKEKKKINKKEKKRKNTRK
jgi:hypothetical protein